MACRVAYAYPNILPLVLGWGGILRMHHDSPSLWREYSKHHDSPGLWRSFSNANDCSMSGRIVIWLGGADIGGGLIKLGLLFMPHLC